MAWKYDTSKKRIEKYRDGLGEITIEKLKKEADLQTLLTPTNCREIYGAHTYVHVSNFAKLASEEINDEDKYKGFIRMVHIYQREVGHIVEDIFGGVRIHFQGAKVHTLFYRPIDDGGKIATKAILLQLVLKDFVKSVFNPTFKDYDNFEIAGGSDIGNAIGTKNGKNGDRELLFLGAPANYAAKIINDHGQLRLTKRVYDKLPKNLKDVCNEVSGEDDLYQVKAVSQSDLDALLKEYDIAWDRDKSQKRLDADLDLFKITDIKYSSATTLIDIDELGIKNNKRVQAASVFGDVTGFTKYIDDATTDTKKKECLKNFHVIRNEMARVVTEDFEGVRVQFQGDRVQAIFHLPENTNSDIAATAVDAAVALQSSMDKTLQDCLTGISSLKMAAGVDMDTTLVTKLGERAHRDRICLGKPVETAASKEEKCDGGDIGITKAVLDELPERLKKHFSWDKSKGCYVASGLTTDKVTNAEKAASYNGGCALAVVSAGAGVAVVKASEAANARPITPPKSYGA